MINASPSIRIGSFLQIAPYLAIRGVSPLEFFQRLGISPNIFQNPDVWLPQAVCFHIANEMTAITQDPFGGAYVGHLTEIRSLGTWGDLILNSADVGQACITAAAHASLLHQGGEIKIINEGRTTKLIHQFTGEWGSDARQFILGSLAVLRKIPLMANEASAIQVHVKGPRERGDNALEEFLGSSLVMNADYNMVEFDRDLLDTQLADMRDDAWKTTEALKCTVETAEMLIKQISDHGQSNLAAVSKGIGISQRTLQRRLKYCGVDFDELRDDTRRAEALKLLANGKYNATEIAHMVGYSDQAHFTRAFRRWTGSTPSRYRPASRLSGIDIG